MCQPRIASQFSSHERERQENSQPLWPALGMPASGRVQVLISNTEEPQASAFLSFFIFIFLFFKWSLFWTFLLLKRLRQKIGTVQKGAGLWVESYTLFSFPSRGKYPCSLFNLSMLHDLGNKM